MLDRSTPVITHVNRHMEPMRGIHPFLRSLPKALNAVPNAEVVVIGNAAQSGYGAKAPDGGTWRDYFLKEIGNKLDLSRVHFLGRTSHEHHDQRAADLGGARLLHLPLRALLVAARGHGLRVPGAGVRHPAGARRHRGRGQRRSCTTSSTRRRCRSRSSRPAGEPEKFQEIRKAARRSVVERFDRKLGRPPGSKLIDEVRARERRA